MPINEGDVLDGKYEIKSLLGEGGMGAVFLAENTLISRKVAIKVLHAQFASEDQVVARFHREARTASMIGHDNIIEILDLGQTPEGSPYIVMELLDGCSLADIIEEGKGLEISRAADIIGQVLSALQAAHDKGIIHRDMKPDNVSLVTVAGRTDFVKVLDFGISKFHAQGSGDHMNLTQTGMVLGTPVYMAPEQAEGRSDLDHRADVFSTGAMLYQMLTGHLPFKASNLQELLRKLLLEEPTNPREYRPDLPDELCDILQMALARDPNERIQTADDFIELLRPFGARHTLFGQTGEMQSIPPPARRKVTVQSTKMGWSDSKAGVAKKKTAIFVGVGIAVVAGVAAALIAIINPFSPEKSGSRASVTVPPLAPEASRASAAVAPKAAADEGRPPPAEEVEKVRIGVSNLPQGARVLIDSKVVEKLPYYIEKSSEPHILAVEASGFDRFEKAFVPNTSLEIAVMMQPESPASRAKKGRSRPASKAASRKKTTGKKIVAIPEPEETPPPKKTSSGKGGKKTYKGAKQIQLQREYPGE